MPNKQVRTIAKDLTAGGESVTSDDLLKVLRDVGKIGQDAKETAIVDADVARECWIQAHAGGETPHDGTQAITAADLVVEYQTTALKDFSLARLSEVAPENFPRVKGEVKKGFVIPPEQLEGLQELLNFLVAVQQTLNIDLDAFSAWDAPTNEQLVEMLHSGAETISYMGICGHEVVQSVDNYRERFESWRTGNSRLSVLLRLCNSCRAERISLLRAGPGVANFQSVCGYCTEATFSGKDPEASFARSRGDIWENLISEIFPVYFLPSRLGPDHTMRHPAHVRMLAAAGKEFDVWQFAFEAEVARLTSIHPEMGDQLKASMASTIREKRIELGLEEA